MSTRTFTGDRQQVEASIYDLATQLGPMDMVEAYDYDFGKAAASLAIGLDFHTVAWNGILIHPKDLLSPYLQRQYEGAVREHLGRLGVSIEVNAISGLRPEVAPDHDYGYSCLICSEHGDSDCYALGSLLDRLISMQSANFDDIWEQLECCRIM